MKGLICLHLVPHRHVPNSDLGLLLRTLMRKPFESLVTCPLHLLSWKKAFLVVIMSARSVGELWALGHNPPYLIIHAEVVHLSLYVTFLP